MLSKRLIKLYDNNCNITISKIMSCERHIKNLEISILEKTNQANDFLSEVNTLWGDVRDKALQQSELFMLKRKESLILFRRDALLLEISETNQLLMECVSQKCDFEKLRLYYQKKKKKWELVLSNQKKIRLRKELYRDEKAMEEHIIWSS